METAIPIDTGSARALLARGAIVDRYVVEELIHRSDAAEVYRVRHASLGLRRALKVLTDGAASSRARFEREARVLAELNHPNIIPVHDVLDVLGHPALLLDDLPGESLRERLDRGRLPVEDAVSLFRRIVAGVAAAHDIGVLHRGLAPDAIWLESVEGQLVPRIADFGVARPPAAGPGLTDPGLTVGTPGYVAPECLAGTASADARSDVFSLGCVLYELVCGVAPFGRPSVVQTQLANFTVVYTAPEVLQPELPASVRETIVRCLAADPERRLGSCAAILDTLRAPTPPRFALPDTAAPLDRLTRVPATAVAGAAARPAARSFEEGGPHRASRRGPAGLVRPGLVTLGLVGLVGLGLAGAALIPRRSEGVEAPTGVPAAPPGSLHPPGAPPAPQVHPHDDPTLAGVAEATGSSGASPPSAAPHEAAGGGVQIPAPSQPPPAGSTPEAPGAAAKAPHGTVTAEGVSDLWLLQGERRFPAGAVAPGTYTILASFGGGALVTAGTVRVADGDAVHLRCRADFMQCRP